MLKPYKINIICFITFLLFNFFILVSTVNAQPQKVDPTLSSLFEVKIRNGFTYCVAPYLAKNKKYYAYELAKKNSEECIGKEWLFDVHGHISYSVDDNTGKSNQRFVCMTDTASNNRNKFSYILLQPCSVNNTRQIWRYDQDTQQMINQHTGNKIQEINWFLATSANADNLYDLQVTGRQILWVLVPAPYTLAFNFNFHYSVDCQSYTQIIGKGGKNSQGRLRYSPETKQISTIINEKQYCLRSNMMGSSKDSEFISFQPCPDQYGDNITPDPLKWNLSASVSGKDNNRKFNIILKDINGNYFGVERGGGINIGTGYTIKPQEAAKIPARFKPLYVFNDTGEIYGRLSYLGGNYVGSLNNQICPAPGVFNDIPDQKTRNKRGTNRLPYNFNIRLWLPRLFQIVTHPGGYEFSGICGPCLLHAVEMILEMHRHGNSPPLNSISPQFFTLYPLMTTMRSFQIRFPILHSEFVYSFDTRSTLIYDPGNRYRSVTMAIQDIAGRVISRLIGGSGLTLSSSFYFNDAEILDTELQDILTELRSSPVGTQFIIISSIFNIELQQVIGHATTFVRTAEGLHSIPTIATDITEQELESLITPDIQHVEQLSIALRHYLPQRYSHVLNAVVFTFSTPATVAATPAEVFDQQMVSVGNCTLGGAAGAEPNIDVASGSGLARERLTDLYQCSDGRCGQRHSH